MENFNHARIYWQEQVMGHKKPRFLECMKDKFLVEVLSN